MGVIGARIEPYHPPQIGERHQVEDDYHRNHRIKMIAMACFLVLSCTLAGALFGGGVGALIGLGISLGVIGVRSVGVPVFHFFFPNLHHIFLDWDQKLSSPVLLLGNMFVVISLSSKMGLNPTK